MPTYPLMLPTDWLIPLCSFFLNATATTEIYTLSLHDALPICCGTLCSRSTHGPWKHAAMISVRRMSVRRIRLRDRKSTRLNSSHVEISYAVFCLKKKKKRDRQFLTYQ